MRKLLLTLFLVVVASVVLFVVARLPQTTIGSYYDDSMIYDDPLREFRLDYQEFQQYCVDLGIAEQEYVFEESGVYTKFEFLPISDWVSE